MEIEQQAMLSLWPADLTGKRCLDLACGSGRYMRLMEAGQARHVFGLDYSAHMLAVRTRYGSAQAVVRGPFAALPFTSDTFDFISCGLAVGHEKDLDQVLSEVARVLRVGGIIVYSDVHPFGALAGWQRTFTADNGTIYRLAHFVHLYGDHVRACRSAGLTIEAVLEPLAAQHTSPDYRDFPAVLVVRAVKESRNY